MNNIDKKTESYLNDNFFSEERHQEVSSNIQQNLEAETGARKKQDRIEKNRKRKNKAAVVGAVLVAAASGVGVARSEDNHQRAIEKQNAPLIKQINANVEANKMQEKADTIGAEQTAATADAEKQVIDAANAENKAETEANNQAIIDANR